MWFRWCHSQWVGQSLGTWVWSFIFTASCPPEWTSASFISISGPVWQRLPSPWTCPLSSWSPASSRKNGWWPAQPWGCRCRSRWYFCDWESPRSIFGSCRGRPLFWSSSFRSLRTWELRSSFCRWAPRSRSPCGCGTVILSASGLPPWPLGWEWTAMSLRPFPKESQWQSRCFSPSLSSPSPWPVAAPNFSPSLIFCVPESATSIDLNLCLCWLQDWWHWRSGMRVWWGSRSFLPWGSCSC